MKISRKFVTSPDILVAKEKIGPSGDMCLRVTNASPLTASVWLLTCFCNGRWQWVDVIFLNRLVWKQDGRFCRVPMLSRTGCAGLRRKVFCYISCSCLPRRKIGTHCVVGVVLWRTTVQAGLVLFDVVLYLHTSVNSGRFLEGINDKMQGFDRTWCCNSKDKTLFNELIETHFRPRKWPWA